MLDVGMKKNPNRRITRATADGKRVLLIPIVLLLVTAHRLPAPIQEIPETPAPTPTVAPTLESKPLSAFSPRPEAPKSRARMKEKPANVSTSAVPEAKRTNGAAVSGGNAIPKGAVHMVLHSDSDYRKVFTYFRFPAILADPGTTGLYRVEVSPEGTVTAVTVLKSMGPSQDTAYMKAFVQWRAVPGPLRLVDVPRRIFRFYRTQSH
ncbi:MAG TPA: hypothetical protein VLK27_11145 [Chthoniobacterales bacterium]|nr:hypothetical protein [Chthoniobacterales bacterium]